MSHKLGGTNSVLLLPFSIINLIKFQKTNLKEERGIFTSNAKDFSYIVELLAEIPRSGMTNYTKIVFLKMISLARPDSYREAGLAPEKRFCFIIEIGMTKNAQINFEHKLLSKFLNDHGFKPAEGSRSFLDLKNKT